MTDQSNYLPMINGRIALLPTWKRRYVAFLFSVYMKLNALIFSAISVAEAGGPVASENGENRWLFIWRIGKNLQFEGYNGSEEGIPAYEKVYKDAAYQKDGTKPWAIFKMDMATMEAGLMAFGYYEHPIQV